MPRVPRLEGPQVRTAPLPVPQVSAEAMGAPIARAVGQIGQIVAEEAERVAQVQGNEALVRMRQARDRILYDRDKGVLTRQRIDAIAAPKVLDEEWNREVSTIAASIKNSSARQRFMEQAARDQAETQSVVLRHVDTELEKMDAETAQDLLTGLGNKISDAAGDAAIVQGAIDEAKNIASDRFARMGLSVESRKIRMGQLVSGMRRRELEALLSRENIDGAEAVFQRVQADLTPDDREAVSKLMERESVAVRSQSIADNAIQDFKTVEEARAAVRGKYSGALEDAAISRINVLFNERETQLRAETEAASDRAYLAVAEGRNIAASDRAILAERNPKMLMTLRSVAETTSKGEPVQTVWAEWTKLAQMPNAEFRDLNLAEYRDVLSDSDYKDMVNRQAGLRGAGGRGTDGVLSPMQVTNETFAEVLKRGLLADDMVRTMADLKRRSNANERFTQLNTEVQAELTAKRAAVTGPLRPEETRAAINAVLDRYTLGEAGFFGRAPLVRAEVPAEYPLPRVGMTRQAYWDMLTAAGISPDSATAIAQREIR